MGLTSPTPPKWPVLHCYVQLAFLLTFCVFGARFRTLAVISLFRIDCLRDGSACATEQQTGERWRAVPPE